MAQCKDSEEEKVSSEKQVDVLLGEELEADVEREECNRSNQREHQCILIRHCLMLLTQFLEQRHIVLIKITTDLLFIINMVIYLNRFHILYIIGK